MICVFALMLWFVCSIVFYRLFFKRLYDIILSFVALIILFPLLIILTVIGAIAMKGNPFFIQKRPGRRKKLSSKKCDELGVEYGSYGNEKIFGLLKFRTMTNERDADGELLPDEKRLNRYGRFLRSTSCDELPSILNILKGDLSIIGPRPLLVRYLPYYTNGERVRHNIRPGLTGYAQVHGRANVLWAERFAYDVYYVNNYSFFLDFRIFFQTIKKVIIRSNIVSEIDFEDLDVERRDIDSSLWNTQEK